MITNDEQILHTSVASNLLRSSSLKLLLLKFIETGFHITVRIDSVASIFGGD